MKFVFAMCRHWCNTDDTSSGTSKTIFVHRVLFKDNLHSCRGDKGLTCACFMFGDSQSRPLHTYSPILTLSFSYFLVIHTSCTCIQTAFSGFPKTVGLPVFQVEQRTIRRSYGRIAKKNHKNNYFSL